MWQRIVLAAVVLQMVFAGGRVWDGRRPRVNPAPILTPMRFVQPTTRPSFILVQGPQPGISTFPQTQPQPSPVPQSVPLPQPFPQFPSFPQPLYVSLPQPVTPPVPTTTLILDPANPASLGQPPVIVPQQPAVTFQPGTPQGGPLSCPFSPETLVHAVHRGREYHFSWCRQPGVTFTFQDAQNYCERLPRDGHPTGFHAVSIETQDEDNFISSTISQYIVPFIWTSGRKVGPNTWMWQSQIASRYTAWSHTGGAGRPQPDDNLGNENCLAVLNNFYNDGILWHDIPCDLDKYVICERPRPYGSG